MRSIVQTDDRKCYLCGGTAYWNDNDMLERLEKHHIFGGNPNRKNSERYGLFVFLHGEKCHRNGKQSVHRNREVRLKVQQDGQRAFEDKIGSREEFRKIFGKSFL